MMLLDFTAVWSNIEQCEGQTFATLTGQPFAYDVQEDALAIRRSDMVLARDEIATAYNAGVSGQGARNGGLHQRHTA